MANGYCDNCYQDTENLRWCSAECKNANKRQVRRRPRVSHYELLCEALNEMFPLGLTDDCPVRKKMTA